MRRVRIHGFESVFRGQRSRQKSSSAEAAGVDEILPIRLTLLLASVQWRPRAMRINQIAEAGQKLPA